MEGNKVQPSFLAVTSTGSITAKQPKKVQIIKRNMKKATIITILAVACSIYATAKAGDVKDIWEKTCAKCHGPDGKGQTKMGTKMAVKDFTDPKVQEAFTDEQAFKALKDGLKDADGKIRMKPVENISDDDIKALVQIVRGFKH